MSWTKRQFVEAAFEEIGMANYAFDLQPDQLQTALKRLDAMIATWNSEGIRVAYPLPSSPEDSELEEETNVPDKSNEAIFKNLAKKIAPAFGKIVTPDLNAEAKSLYKNLLRTTSDTPKRLLKDIPKGAGNKPFRMNTSKFINQTDDNIKVGSDGDLILE